MATSSTMLSTSYCTHDTDMCTCVHVGWEDTNWNTWSDDNTVGFHINLSLITNTHPADGNLPVVTLVEAKDRLGYLVVHLSSSFQSTPVSETSLLVQLSPN